MSERKIGPFFTADRQWDSWKVHEVNRGDLVGLILWSGPNREYLFAPSDLTTFTAEQMIDIGKFLEQAEQEADDADN